MKKIVETAKKINAKIDKLADLFYHLKGMFGCQRAQWGNEIAQRVAWDQRPQVQTCYNLPGSPSLCSMCWLYQFMGVNWTQTEAEMKKNMITYYEKHR